VFIKGTKVETKDCHVVLGREKPGIWDNKMLVE
jgi:hypothetical protein